MRNRKPLILVLLLISTTFIAANNLITNPGFEEWSSGWKKKEISGFAEVSIDENYAFEGWGSAKIEAITLAEAYWETKEAYIVEEGQEFALSASVRTEFVQGGDGAVAIAYFEDAFGRKIAENVILNLAATNDWKELSQLIKVPAGATYMKVRLGLRGASGTVCWDQIFLSNEAEAIRNARAKAEQKISINEGFDEGLKGWRTIDREGKLEYATDEKVKYSGRNAVKLASNDDKARGWIQKAFEIEGGKSYTIKVWGKTNEVSVSAALRVKLFNSNNEQLAMEGNPFQVNKFGDLVFPELIGTVDWQEINGWFVAPAGTTKLLVELLLSGFGTVWWDDLLIEEVDEVAQGEQPPVFGGENEIILLHPANGDKVPANPPAFIWSKLGGEYTLMVSADEAFTNPKQIKVAEGSIYIPYWLFEPGVWFWQVSAHVGGQEIISSTSSFEVEVGLKEFRMPSSEELKAQIPDSHPRVFFLEEDLPELRKAVTGESKVLWQQLSVTLDSKIGAPLLPDPEGYKNNIWNEDDWRRIWADSRVVRDNMINYAFGYLISGDERYLEEAKRWMLCAAAWDPNGSTSDRSNDEASRAVLEGLSIAYDWLYHELSPRERELVLTSMLTRGDEMYNLITQSIKMEINPYNSHGWNKVGILAQCAVAIYGDCEIAEIWLTHNMRLLMGRWPAWGGSDGGWSEGVYYQAPYIERYLRPALALRKATGIDLFQHPWFDNGQNFLLYGWAPGTVGAEFGDGGFAPPNENAIMNSQKLALVKRNPYLQWYVDMAGGVSFTPNVPEAFLWNDRLEPKPPIDIPQAHAFFDVGFAALHSNMSDPSDNIILTFKSSPYGAMSHSHADQNTFNISAFGERLAIDSGHYDYYGSPHHNRWTRQTIAHNTILVNGQGQDDRAALNMPPQTGELTGFITSDHFDYVAGEAGAAYKGQLDLYHRQIIYLRPDYYILADALKGPEGARYDWLLHSLEEMDVDEENKQIKVNQGKALLKINFVEPAVLSFSQNNNYPAEPSRTFPKEWHLKATAQAQGEEQRFLAIMNVSRRDEEKEINFCNLSKGHTLALKLKDNGLTTYAGFNYGDNSDFEDILTDARAFAIEYSGDRMQSFLVEKGTHLHHGKRIFYRSTSSSSASLGLLKAGMDGIVQLEKEGAIEVYVPFEPKMVLVDGNSIPFNKNGDLLQFSCKEGQHEIFILLADTFVIPESEITINVEGLANTTIKLHSDGQHRLGGYTLFNVKAGMYQLEVRGKGIADSFKLSIDHKPIAFELKEEVAGVQTLVTEGLLMGHNNIISFHIYDENAKFDLFSFEPLAFASPQKPVAYESSPLALIGTKVLVKAEDFVREGGGSCNLTTTHKARYGKGIMSWGEKGHWLEWDFNVPESGEYLIMLGGATTYPQVIRSLTIDGEFPVAQLRMLEFNSTGGWGYELGEWADFPLSDKDGESIVIHLEKGTHNVRMTSLDSWMNLAYIAFIKQ